MSVLNEEGTAFVVVQAHPYPEAIDLTKLEATEEALRCNGVRVQ